jgi:radical SAM protein with 4Fe4S-binding SPASM domain
LPKFSTNGLLLTKDKIQELVSMGDFSVAVDFASDAKYFENIRGSREDYFAILENLRFMFEAAKKNRKIKLEIDDISNFAGPGIKESLDSMKSLFPEHAASNIVFNSRDFHNFCGHLPLNKKNARYEVCVYPWVAFDVTWNGDVVSCCRDTEARTVLGNVFKESVKDIWYGDRYIELRRNLIEKCPDKIKACKGCDMPYSGRINYFKIANALSFLFRR